MPILENNALETFSLPGLVHRTVAGPEHGMRTMEVWMQTIAPGGATPVHRHACEEVIVVLSGSGQLTIEEEELDFGPNTTLIVPPDAVHQLVNTGEEPMFLIAALGKAPVEVRTARGEPSKASTNCMPRAQSSVPAP